MRALILLLAIAPSIAASQSALDVFQSVVNRNGESCPNITDSQGIGRMKNGNTLVAIACSNGGRHVMEIVNGNSVHYLTTCSRFESMSSAECFR